MIAKLNGVIDSLLSDSVIIDVNGVGYLVFCSAKTIAKLAVGEKAVLFIETQVREDAFNLFGFISEKEKNTYKLLTNVQGVGAKGAMAILSALNPLEILDAIAAADATAICAAQGIGPKIASRIINELKDKIGKIEALGEINLKQNSPFAAKQSSLQNEALSALVNLGYSKMEAFGLINRISLTLKENLTVENIIKEALKEIGKNKV